MLQFYQYGNINVLVPPGNLHYFHYFSIPIYATRYLRKQSFAKDVGVGQQKPIAHSLYYYLLLQLL